MTGEMEWALTGKWRIIEADLWGRDYLAPVEPAHITFEGNGHGEFTFGCVNGGLDCEYSRQIIFFTWQGFEKWMRSVAMVQPNSTMTGPLRSKFDSISATKPF